MKKTTKNIVRGKKLVQREENHVFLKLAVLFVIVVIAIIGLWVNFFGSHDLNIQTPNGVVSFKVERALTPAQQQKGLMFRESLGEKEGMIFLFAKNRIAQMWMKNTFIPLDMIFFDDNGHVVLIHRNAQPLDLKLISSVVPVAGVLEINAGASKKFGINTRSKLDLKMVR